MIPVTKPFLPPKEEYDQYLNSIWKRNWLTNNGPLVNELELKLKKYLGVKHLLYLGNGTIALQIAIKALGLKGEIITTPFSYVATTSSIVWEGCKPIFVDIDPKTFNIDPKKIEAAITQDTSAILATHCFGNPCDIDAIQKIADKHKLKVIYDSAHCFGTKYKGKSVFEFGDISTASFHSTKLFHTVEGGAVFTQDSKLLKKMAHMRNFGHDGPEKYAEIGINGKNSEFHAAMGLVNLKYVDDILDNRKDLSIYYDERLKNLQAKRLTILDNSEPNYSYYPIIFESEAFLLDILNILNKMEIYPRRYFYPGLNQMPYLESSDVNLEISNSVSKRVLCLPLYFELSKEEIDLICRLILRVQNN
ncbi:MAG: DegT/DnrJ/EryC1/StrS family aminotransferase [Cyclobacterium sp.]|uniref:DegT/DnrJ/EryC1/StrS family aminotransferase n=1 Tax=Cyclobacterium sp. TaxID=1966343 RepID=UPI003970AAE1